MSLGRKLLFLYEMNIGMSYALSFRESLITFIIKNFIPNEVSSLRYPSYCSPNSNSERANAQNGFVRDLCPGQRCNQP